MAATSCYVAVVVVVAVIIEKSEKKWKKIWRGKLRVNAIIYLTKPTFTGALNLYYKHNSTR